ncbi:hypothetical protein SDRG_05021 [Saprolegnia diclina VS20]|uniref:Uncharacterized protein n=1 Tax=Saprolegnia diclina (strain VS20) TaxID=1156394 RepID=T0S3R9_SAPDV|nr:hypothetical protein SDRG_05021 [Saprolegnia diclina VS20]EQC37417.1 hypothetical protein SDRG_05021 [Saprolegnia diclina VS20]|eukprot:XP_008608937.1 hypothetical protein SDRG_05021 [Saprolegnia diclina VS20]
MVSFESDDTGAWDLASVVAYVADDVAVVNRRDSSSGRSLLHEACVHGQKHVVVHLLQHTSCDLHSTTMLGRATPLHLAVHAAHRSLVFWLLSYGADATAKDRFGSTPLHYCTKRTIAQHLVQFGARCLTSNLRRQTAALAIKTNVDAEADLQEYIAVVAVQEAEARKAALRAEKRPKKR